MGRTVNYVQKIMDCVAASPPEEGVRLDELAVAVYQVKVSEVTRTMRTALRHRLARMADEDPPRIWYETRGRSVWVGSPYQGMPARAKAPARAQVKKKEKLAKALDRLMHGGRSEGVDDG